MEVYINSIALISLIVFVAALTSSLEKFKESKELYKKATGPPMSEYTMSVYRVKISTLKSLLCIAIITGYMWISTALYHTAVVFP